MGSRGEYCPESVFTSVLENVRLRRVGAWGTFVLLTCFQSLPQSQHISSPFLFLAIVLSQTMTKEALLGSWHSALPHQLPVSPAVH